MSALKAEFLHQFYKSHRRPINEWVFGHFGKLSRLATKTRPFTGWILSDGFAGGRVKRLLGVAPLRSLPGFSKTTLRQWYRKEYPKLRHRPVKKGALYFFCDEFTNFQEAEIGIQVIELLVLLGYEVELVRHPESGRALISKGFLRAAKRLANEQLRIFSPLVSDERPLIGIEPSAILAFRDDYLRLADDKEQARKLKSNVLSLEEFLYQEAQKGKITSEDFKDDQQKILLHGHCHQKAISGVGASAFILSLPKNFEVEHIASGCCGMAGSFGYEKANFDLSMKIGEMVLFPAVRQAKADTIIAAAGTSCRHQIFDGTGKLAFHPGIILRNAIKPSKI